MRVGMGYDIHRLVTGRKLVLGGVDIPFSKGEDGYSDGDVLIHAIIDALLGCANMGDIGSNFPPGTPELEGISSRVLLEKTRRKLEAGGYSIVNLDCTVILEMPKILPYVAAIRESIASVLAIPPERVSVKGKTKEGVDAAGEGKAVEAHAVALLQERR